MSLESGQPGAHHYRHLSEETDKEAHAGAAANAVPDDQTLLMLRIDRGLSWRDLALAISSEEGASSDEAISINAARLRKRFEQIKQRLRELAVQQGVIDDD